MLAIVEQGTLTVMLCRRWLGLLTATAALVGGCSSQEHAASVGEKTTKVVVEGKNQPVTGQVVCVTAPTGDVNVSVGAAQAPGTATQPKPTIMADLTMSDGPPYVSLLSINLPDIALSIGHYRHVEQPTLQIDGKSYRINGKAAVGNEANPAGYKQFEVEVTCP
jgi:ipoprotein LpqH